MGIYNNIHTSDDDHYYYCPVSDCPCHQPDYHDSSRNHTKAPQTPLGAVLSDANPNL